ncbi:kinetoplast-associated protein kap [Colletotrichum musicola]|uniref:Kinetoplast-associated protein kap n=1 Tax=Colletotrichum musicola TaxID=2175873 RepID=A0A8H6NZR3_9PEZI|nr:kinetoplast-associated protein kap [Colletotrichum musicola]
MSRRTSHIRIVDAKNTRSGTSSEDDTTERDDDGDTFDSLSSSDSNSNRPVRGFSPRKPRPYTQTTAKGKGIASSQQPHHHNHKHHRDPPDRDTKREGKRDTSPGEGPSRRNVSRRHSYRPAMEPFDDPYPPMGGYGANMNPTTYTGAGARYSRHSIPPIYPQSHVYPSPYGSAATYPLVQHNPFAPFSNASAPPTYPFVQPGQLVPFSNGGTPAPYMPQYVPQYLYSAPPAPPPPPTEVPPPSKTPAPAPALASEERIVREIAALKEERRAQEMAVMREAKSARENPEIENLKRELEEKRREMEAREREARKREEEAKLRKEIEESFRAKMEAMKKAEENARAEIERVKLAADAEARAALEAEMARQRESQAAIEKAKKEAQEELLAQMRADAERRALDEEERRRSLEAAEAKVAGEIEAQRKQREEDEETRDRLLRELKEEIRAEFIQDQSKGRHNRAAQRTLPPNRHAAATPADSTVDPFEFFEGYSTPFPGQPEPGSFEEAYWPRRQFPMAWPYQFHMPGGRDQAYMQARRSVPGASYDYQQRSMRPEEFAREQPANPAANNSQPAPRRPTDSNAPGTSSFASVDGNDSDNVTVIPASTYKNGSQPAQGVESHLNVGLASLNLANGDAGLSRAPNGVPHNGPGKQKQNGSWSASSTADEHDDRGAADTAGVPDTDGGGANLEGGTTTWPPATNGNPERFQTPPNRPSLVRKETARDSPLMPVLAKHLSDFEERSSQSQRSASRQSQTMADFKADDVFSRPVPSRDVRYSDWVEDEAPHDPALPYSLARRDQWAVGRQPGQQAPIPGGGFDYGAGFPIAFVPCVMVPVHMMQVSMLPASYQGMAPRKNRRQQGMRI